MPIEILLFYGLPILVHVILTIFILRAEWPAQFLTPLLIALGIGALPLLVAALTKNWILVLYYQPAFPGLLLVLVAALLQAFRIKWKRPAQPLPQGGVLDRLADASHEGRGLPPPQ